MQRKLLVKDYMTTKLEKFLPNEDINFAFNKLKTSDVRQAPVVDDGSLVGIITERDIRVALTDYTDHPYITVENVMTKTPYSIREDSKIEDAAELMVEKKINAVPVLDISGELKGIITTTDILRGFISFCKNS